MRIIIEGKTYSDKQPFIGDLRLLKGEFGFGWGTVLTRFDQFVSGDPLLVLDEPDLVDGLIAFVWMTLLRNGQRDVTRAEVEKLPMDEIQFLPDRDEEPAAEADPTQTSELTDSDPAASKPKAERGSTRGSTKTSSKRSTRG